MSTVLLVAAVLCSTVVSSLTLSPVTCANVVSALSNPSLSLVEGCDLGPLQLSIASNSIVTLRSTILGGVVFLPIGRAVANITLHLENCSVVGTTDPWARFLGSYQGNDLYNVVLTMEANTILERNSQSLSGGASQAGIMHLANGAIKNFSLALIHSKWLFKDNISLQSSRALVEFEFVTQFDSVSFLIESSEIAVAGSMHQDMLVVSCDSPEGNRINMANVSFVLIDSVMSLIFTAGSQVRLLSSAFNLWCLTIHQLNLLVSRSTVAIADDVPQNGVVQEKSHLLSVNSNFFSAPHVSVTDSTLRIRAAVESHIVTFGWGAMIDNALMELNNVTFYSVVAGILNARASLRESVALHIADGGMVDSELSFISLFISVEMCIGQSLEAPTAAPLMTDYKIMFLHSREVNNTHLVVKDSQVVLATIDGRVESKAIGVRVWLLYFNNPTTFPVRSTNTTAEIYRSSVISTIDVRNCSAFPLVIITTSLMFFGTASRSLTIVVHDSFVVMTRCIVMGAFIVQRIIGLLTTMGNTSSFPMLNATVLVENATLDTMQLEDAAMLSAVQLPQSIASSSFRFGSISFRYQPAARTSLAMCADSCFVDDSTLAFTNISVVASSTIMRSEPVVSFLGSSLQFLSCTVTLDNVHLATASGVEIAAVPSSVQQLGSTAWTLRRTSFNGFRRFFNSSPPVSVTVALDGCHNRWDTAPTHKRDIGAPRSSVTVLQGEEKPGERNCARLEQTSSVTNTNAGRSPLQRKSFFVSVVSAASVAGSVASLLSSVPSVASSLQVLSQRADDVAACANIARGKGDDNGDDDSFPFSDIASNPLQLSIASLGWDLASAGGCIVSSTIVATAFFLLRFIVVVIDHKLSQSRFDVKSALKWPGSLYPSLMFVLQPVVGASVLLISSPQRSYLSVAFGLVALMCCCVLPCSYFCWNVIVPWRNPSGVLIDCRARQWWGDRSGGRCFNWQRTVFAERWEWCCPRTVIAEGRTDDCALQASRRIFLVRMIVVLRSYARDKQQFLIVEVAFATLSGIIGGTFASLSLSTRCVPLAQTLSNGLQALLMAAMLVLVLVLRPYNTLLGDVLSSANSILAILSLALAIILSDAANDVVSALTLSEVVLCAVPLVWIGLRYRLFREIGFGAPSHELSTVHSIALSKRNLVFCRSPQQSLCDSFVVSSRVSPLSSSMTKFTNGEEALVSLIEAICRFSCGEREVLEISSPPASFNRWV